MDQRSAPLVGNLSAVLWTCLKDPPKLKNLKVGDTKRTNFCCPFCTMEFRGEEKSFDNCLRHLAAVHGYPLDINDLDLRAYMFYILQTVPGNARFNVNGVDTDVIRLGMLHWSWLLESIGSESCSIRTPLSKPRHLRLREEREKQRKKEKAASKKRNRDNSSNSKERGHGSKNRHEQQRRRSASPRYKRAQEGGPSRQPHQYGDRRNRRDSGSRSRDRSRARDRDDNNRRQADRPIEVTESDLEALADDLD